MNDIQQKQQQQTTMAELVGGQPGVPGSWGHTATVGTGTFTFPDHPLVHVRDYSYAFPYADSYHGRFDVPPTAQAPKPHHWSESDLPTPEPLITEESTTLQSNTSLTQQRNITLGTLSMAWVLFATLAAMSLHRMCKPRYTQRKKIATVRSYLTRFKDNDVKVFKSPPGGLNVLYHQKRLVNRLKYYWSGELPDPEDASTILFENDVEDQNQPRLHSCWTFSCSDGYMEEDSWSRTTGSSSSESQTSTSSRASYYTQTQAHSSSNDQGSKTKDMRRRLRIQNNIIHVLQNSSFSLVDVRLGDSSISGDGFSVTYRRSLRDRMGQDDDNDDEDDEEVIDFQPLTGVQSGRDTLLSSFPELEILHGESLSVSGGEDTEESHMEAGEADNSNFW